MEEQFRFEVAVIGDAIEYLEKHVKSVIESNSVPGTDILDRESKLWVEELQELIENLKFGTVGGRTFERERKYKKNEAEVAEAWKKFRDDYPEYFR